MTYEELWLSQQAFLLPKTGSLAIFDVAALEEIARGCDMRSQFATAILEVIDNFNAAAAPARAALMTALHQRTLLKVAPGGLLNDLCDAFTQAGTDDYRPYPGLNGPLSVALLRVVKAFLDYGEKPTENEDAP